MEQGDDSARDVGGWTGPGRILITWIKGHLELKKMDKELERERERNRSVADHVQTLPGGSEFMDYEANGRQIWVRKSVTTPPPPTLFLLAESGLTVELARDEDSGPTGELAP
jgi:hypothetical protein